MRLMIQAVSTAFLAVFLTTSPAFAKCSFNICKGEKAIVYDENHRRVGTIENRGYGTKRLQMRDNKNRITGYIDGSGRTYDSNHRRTGSVGTSKSTSKPWWR